jgi:heme exporter protein C
MRFANRLAPFLLVIAALMLARAPFMIEAAPVEATMGIIQKIFYYHVPSAIMAFMGAFVCGVASAVYLYSRNRFADHVALSAAELTVVFGLIMLVTGPLWARKAWGAWWVWDVRLTMALILWMIFVAYLLLRRFGGPGSDVLAAAVGVFGTALVPFVYVSVNYWRTIHPSTKVIGSLPPEMAGPFRWSVFAFLALFAALLLVRIRLESSRTALDEAFVALED